MNTKFKIFIFLIMCVILSGCKQPKSLADGFFQFDSTVNISTNDLTDPIPAFSFKYPPEWQYAWVGDSGIQGLLISSGDIEAAWNMQDYSGAAMIIIPIDYSGEDLSDLFYTTLGGGERLESFYSTNINGLDAAWGEISFDELLLIEVVLVKEDKGLTLFASFPPEKEEEFRPLIEAIISTIEIQ